MSTVRWTSDRDLPKDLLPLPLPSLRTAVSRGLLGHCPACGKTHLFSGYLKVVRECSACSAPLGAARADDLPPYFTILLVGHVVVPLLLWTERATELSTLTMSAIFLPLTLVMSLALLRPIKGGTVGLMMKLGMMKPDPDQG